MTPSRAVMILVCAAAAAVLPVASVGAQDVEMLGRHYGTPVPASYYETMARDADAFRFNRGRALRTRQEMEARARLRASGLAAVLGPRDGPVEGTFTIPVLLGRFADSPVVLPYDESAVHDRFFGASGLTARTYYEEVSGGRVSLRGAVRPWATGSSVLHTRGWVTNGGSGLSSRTPVWIKGLLSTSQVDDWGRFDNDGPDGIPNSGDDDGFVDALAVIHPTEGAECRSTGSEDRIWSHKWSLSTPTGTPFTTTTPAAGGGFILVDDYFIVGVRSCGGSALNDIGVFTHETGHAFGLPDLYDTGRDNRHSGAGNWDLMATGSWGCNNRSPAVPCHMGAWSKAVLGWLDVVDIPAGSGLTRVTLPPVAAEGVAYRVATGDGSGEYFLLENRQRQGFDSNLQASGLLVWHIDPDWVQARWSSNSVNAGPHRGVWLRQADGRDDLGSPTGTRSDDGDPFPHADNDDFHASSSPASWSHEGSATGVTLLDIERAGPDIRFSVSNRLSRVALRTAGLEERGDLFTVDGRIQRGSQLDFMSAPFQRHTLEAAGGWLLGPGVRIGFEGWDEHPAGVREIEFVTPLSDSTFLARYSGRQVQLAMETRSDAAGVDPATFHATPFSDDLWFSEGADVFIEARPLTGFGFLEWSGALAGEPNPANIVMSGPAQAGADFEVTFRARSAELSFEAATPQSVGLEVVDGNQPINWLRAEGSLPNGLLLTSDGLVRGVPMETGSFSLVVEARDAIGLTARATVRVDVSEPRLAAAVLAAPWLLTGTPLTLEQSLYLDRAGNGNGRYDLGDLRAWVLSHPEVPLTEAVRALVGIIDGDGRSTPGREDGP